MIYNINIDLLENDILKKYNKILDEKIHKSNKIGKINGMYATYNHTGGLCVIEATEIPSDSKLQLQLTGQQGDVMKESMLVSKTVAWNIIPDKYKTELMMKWKKYGSTGFHIHCPEGSTPKDGPSAGLAITVAIISVLTRIPIKNNISITGEIDLDGNALQIGGLVDKLYGAKNAGIKIALFPKDNINDFKKIKMEYPDLIKKGEFEAYSISNIYEALEYLLCDNKITFSNYLEKYNNIYK